MKKDYLEFQPSCRTLDSSLNLSEESPMTKATSFVSESMKVMGDTVSRLSKSFSIDKNTSLDETSMNDSIPLSSIEKSLERSESAKKSRPGSKTVIRSKNQYTFSHHRRSQSVTSFSKMSPEKDFVTPKPKDVFCNEVWTWGKGSRGQQGHGDMLDRIQPLPITDLMDLGM